MTLTAMLAAVLATVPLPQGPTIDVLSLRHLTLAPQPARPTPWGSFLQRPTVYYDLLAQSEEALGVDAILQVLQHPEIPEEHLRLTPDDNNLIATGRQQEVQQVRERLQALSALLARPCRIEFAVWDLTDGETPQPFLDAAQLQAFTANRQPLWRCAAATHCGRTATLERLRWADYVRDLEGHVAQKIAMTSPAVSSFGEGGQAVVQVHGLAGGDELVVHLQFAVAQKRGVVRTLQTGMPGAPDIDLPVLETSYGACSGRIQNGGALAITLRGHAIGGSQLVMTCRVDCAPAAPEASRDLGLFPIGALTSAALTQAVELATGDNDDLVGSRRDPSLHFGRLSMERVVELVALAVDTQEVPVEAIGDHLFVRGTAEQRGRIESLLRGLQDQVLRNASLQHVATLAPGDTGSTATPTQATLHQLTLPTLLGRQAMAVRMIETNVVRQILPLMSTESSQLDPQFAEMQSGTWLRACLLPAGRSLQLDATIRCSHAPIPATRTVMPGGGVLMPLDIATRMLHHSDALAAGKPAEHGDGPTVAIEGRSYRSVLTTTVRW